MIDPLPPVWLARISSRIFFFKDSTCAWSKDEWPLIWLARLSPRIFFKRFNMSMVKRCLTPSPQVWQTRISPTILKFTFSHHMVKDDWPWWRLLHERPFTREGNYLFITHCSHLNRDKFCPGRTYFPLAAIVVKIMYLTPVARTDVRHFQIAHSLYLGSILVHDMILSQNCILLSCWPCLFLIISLLTYILLCFCTLKKLQKCAWRNIVLIKLTLT